MSNGDTRVIVSSEGLYHLAKAIEIALVYHTGEKSSRRPPGCEYYLVKDNGIYFAWGAPERTELTKLPARMGIESLASLCLGWLKESAVYPKEPDMDGHCSKGWTLKSGYQNMPSCNDQFYLSFGVTPEWMEYHK